jgi:hypothetical protein
MDDLQKYTSPGFRAVLAEGPAAAARIFAAREARREMGRRAYVRTMRLDSWTKSGTTHTYECFIGRDVRGGNGETVGRNCWVPVHAA